MNDEMTIDLVDLFGYVKKYYKLIILLGILGFSAAFLISKFVLTEEFNASTTLIVSEKSTDASANVQYNDLLVNQKLVSTYAEIMKSRTVLDQVITDLKLPITSAALSGKITVQSVKDTEILRLTVRDEDPKRASQVANALAEIFKERIVQIKQLDNVQTIDPAQVPSTPVRPLVLQNALIGGVLGVMLGGLYALIKEMLDKSVKSAEEIEALLDLPVIGNIPKMLEVK